MDVIALKQSNNKKVLYVFLLFSLTIHTAISFTTIKDVFTALTMPEEAEQKITLKLIQPQEKNLKQIAETEQSDRNKVDKARFYSNKNNAFARETKNANNGTFQAAGKGQRKALEKRDLQVAKKAKSEKLKKLKFSDLSLKFNEDFKVQKKKKVAKQNSARKGLKNGRKKGVGLGQTNDFLEDIPLGDFTRLNTQEYEFYGFYNRIKEKLEQFWGSNIQEQADKIYKGGRSIASESNLTTGLTISLNSKGEIVDIFIKSPSGVRELDDAAIDSFNQAGPFPNPPKGMIKNGKATIEWGFVVNT